MANVPQVPGVPPLTQAASIAVSAAVLTQDAIQLLGLILPRWGIYRDGAPVIVASSVVALQFKQSYSIMDFPIEGGGFESYNKVTVPFDVRVRISSGGTFLERAALLLSAKSIASDTLLYQVVTPEDVYFNCNVVDFEYVRRYNQGAGMIQIDLALKEVRAKATTTFSNSQTPSGATATNGGTVQTSEFSTSADLATAARGTESGAGGT